MSHPVKPASQSTDSSQAAKMQNIESYSFEVSRKNRARRLDVFVAGQPQLQNISRSRLRTYIRSGDIKVNGKTCKASYRLKKNDQVMVRLPPPLPSTLISEKIFFQILHEDKDIIILSKPPGLVVHPACGHFSGTLVHGLLHHCRNLSGIGGELRPGIVHRLDKDTSGIMIVAKNDPAHQSLSGQFKKRSMEKIYLALLVGQPPSREGRIDLAIGRHPVNRKKMAVRKQTGRTAITRWKVLEKFDSFSLVQIKLDTGRTHQIRVHMAALGCPVAGDRVYGGNKFSNRFSVPRQYLHAFQLTFDHPRSHDRLRFAAPLWNDMDIFLRLLREEKKDALF